MCHDLEYYGSLLIMSKDRDAHTNINNAHYSLKNNLSGFDYFSVRSVQLTNNIYPINERNWGLTTVFGVAPEVLNVTFTPGNYTATQIASTLTTLLNTASVANGYTTVYSVSYNNITNKLTISTSVNPGNLETVSGTASEFLGFSASVLNLSASYTATNPINLIYTQNMSITSQQWLQSAMHPNIRSDLKAGGIIYNVPIGTLVFGQNYYLENRHQGGNMIAFDRSQIINNFNITLLDDRGDLIPMNNSEYIIELNLYKKRGV